MESQDVFEEIRETYIKALKEYNRLSESLANSRGNVDRGFIDHYALLQWMMGYTFGLYKSVRDCLNRDEENRMRALVDEIKIMVTNLGSDLTQWMKRAGK